MNWARDIKRERKKHSKKRVKTYIDEIERERERDEEITVRDTSCVTGRGKNLRGVQRYTGYRQLGKRGEVSGRKSCIKKEGEDTSQQEDRDEEVSEEKRVEREIQREGE